MGYHVSITRETAEKKSDITIEEWRSFVIASDALSFYERSDEGEVSDFSKSISLAIWNKDGYSSLGCSHGEIWAKNPSDEFVEYMIKIAPSFNARVRGDEGEYYRSLDDYYYEENGREVSREEKEQEFQKEMRVIKAKRLFWNIIRMIILAAALFLVICKKK